MGDIYSGKKLHLAEKHGGEEEDVCCCRCCSKIYLIEQQQQQHQRRHLLLSPSSNVFICCLLQLLLLLLVAVQQTVWPLIPSYSSNPSIHSFMHRWFVACRPWLVVPSPPRHCFSHSAIALPSSRSLSPLRPSIIQQFHQIHIIMQKNK